MGRIGRVFCSRHLVVYIGRDRRNVPTRPRSRSEAIACVRRIISKWNRRRVLTVVVVKKRFTLSIGDDIIILSSRGHRRTLKFEVDVRYEPESILFPRAAVYVGGIVGGSFPRWADFFLIFFTTRVLVCACRVLKTVSTFLVGKLNYVLRRSVLID